MARAMANVMPIDCSKLRHQQPSNKNSVQSLAARAGLLLKWIPTGQEGRLGNNCNARLGLELFVILSELINGENSGDTINTILESLAKRLGWIHDFLAAFRIVFDGASYSERTVGRLCNGMSVFTLSEHGQEFVTTHKDDIHGINIFLYGWFPESKIRIAIAGVPELQLEAQCVTQNFA
uniref:Uncharacterized protein n=1 Tax=Strigamia maritima TaxID=126957 RepID=T1IQL6_STRMM